jgi:hypothetical protein
MGEAFIVRRGGVVSETTAAPTITIISEDPTGVTFTLTNNDDNTAFITYEIDDVLEVIELAAAATSDSITIALDPDTYTLTAYATVVGEVATKSEEVVEIVQIFEFELLYDSLTAANGSNAVPATQLDITGLSIGKNDELFLSFTNKIPSQTFTFFSIFPNDNTTQTNYHTQDLGATGTSFDVNRGNANRYAYARLNGNNTGFASIKISENNRFVVQSHATYNGTGSSASEGLQQFHYNIVGSGFTLTSITKLTLLSSLTNGFNTGARVRLYKVNTGEA